jgi:hypothetical protein
MMLSEKAIHDMVTEVTEILDKIEECIEKVWYELKNERERTIWWDEQELILPFYFYLRPMISGLNEHLEKIQLYLVPEYAPKASSYAAVLGEKYPICRKNGKEFARTKKVDLCVIAFDSSDFERRRKDSKTTYWYIRHAPIVLFEFKLLMKKDLLPKMEIDFKKLTEIARNYEGVQRLYFCCLTDEQLLEKECRDMLDKMNIRNLRICYGTADGKNWGIISYP